MNKLQRFFALLLFGITTCIASYSQEYKGVWFRAEYEPGISLNDVPTNLKDAIGGNGLVTQAGAFTVGYHFNKWSIGLGGSGITHQTPHWFGHFSLFLDGQIRPFEGKLTPLGINLRAGIPLSNVSDNKATFNSRFAVSWAFRKKLWNLVGAEIAAGVGYIPYTAEVLIFPEGKPHYSASEATSIEKHSLYKLNAFLSLAILIN